MRVTMINLRKGAKQARSGSALPLIAFSAPIAGAGLLALIASAPAGADKVQPPEPPPLEINDSVYAEELSELGHGEARDTDGAAVPVTYDDYMAAVNETTLCVETESEGDLASADLNAEVAEVAIEEPSEDAFQISYQYVLDTSNLRDEARVEEANLIVRDVELFCVQTHLQSTEKAYQLAQMNDPEYVDTVSADFIQCATEGGYPALDGEAPRELLFRVAAEDGGVPPVALEECLHRYPSINTVLQEDGTDS